MDELLLLILMGYTYVLYLWCQNQFQSKNDKFNNMINKQSL